MPQSNNEDLTNQELLHYLRDAIETQKELREAVEALRTEIAQTYVRKDVWLEARKNDAAAGLALQEQVRGLVSQRDWAIKLIVGAIIVALLGLVLVSNGGATP